jgi:hypothetical protein
MRCKNGYLWLRRWGVALPIKYARLESMMKGRVIRRKIKVPRECIENRHVL